MSLSVCSLHPGLCWSPTACPTPMAGVLLAVYGGCMCPQEKGSASMAWQSFRKFTLKSTAFLLESHWVPRRKA